MCDKFFVVFSFRYFCCGFKNEYKCDKYIVNGECYGFICCVNLKIEKLEILLKVYNYILYNKKICLFLLLMNVWCCGLIVVNVK